ncbi:MAG: hypothetical protein RR767_05385, partial [Acinetobacter sp.]
MKISHILLCSILSLVMTKNTYALTESQEKIQVLNVIKKYAEVTACMTTFDKDSEERTTLKDVYTIDREPS